jgi:hypothetical protein
MFHKLMAGIVFISVPVLLSGVAQVATTGPAGAASSTICTLGSDTAPVVTTFAAPGISDQGTAQVSSTTNTKLSTGSISCTGGKPGTGTVKSKKVKSKSTLRCKNDSNPPAPCPSGDYVYDSVGQFVGGASTLYETEKSTSWTIKSTAYAADYTSSEVAPSGSTGPGSCPNSEIGVVIFGKLSMPSSQAGKATVITDCFGTDTGPGTGDNFESDIDAELGGNTTIVITKATLDPATSSIEFA